MTLRTPIIDGPLEWKIMLSLAVCNSIASNITCEVYIVCSLTLSRQNQCAGVARAIWYFHWMNKYKVAMCYRWYSVFGDPTTRQMGHEIIHIVNRETLNWIRSWFYPYFTYNGTDLLSHSGWIFVPINVALCGNVCVEFGRASNQFPNQIQFPTVWFISLLKSNAFKHQWYKKTWTGLL